MKLIKYIPILLLILSACAAETEQRTAELEQKIRELENNPDLLEKIAREEYGMRKPGETVYRIQRAQ